ncbi:hypothetical protein ACH45E_36915 [Streptomyces sp. NPDC020299]|uniref:hypothetical protein n=1 Tax=Streptomyces sp. NPDC020299 TaxID=3365067 RepID=UPI0037A1A926
MTKTLTHAHQNAPNHSQPAAVRDSRLRTYYEAAGYTVAGVQAAKNGGTGSPYAVTLLEKRLK